MPYIITTHTPTGQTVQEGTVCAVTTRTAVATLAEVVRVLNETGEPWTLNGANGEGGGTIGPLPDGTVIEMRPMDTIACPGNQYHGACGKPAHWRGSASLTPLHPHGAWECSDTRCWTMTTPDEFNAR